jgi:hypothetical protein
VDYGDSLEKKNQEMEKLDSIFEERTKNLAYILNMHQEEGAQQNMENMKSELPDDTKESMLERDEEKDTEEGGFKMVKNKKVKYVTASRNNSRLVDMNSMVMDKEK